MPVIMKTGVINLKVSFGFIFMLSFRLSQLKRISRNIVRTAIKYLTGLTPSATITVTRGAGGAGATATVPSGAGGNGVIIFEW